MLAMLFLQFLIDKEMPFDPEYLYSDVRVSGVATLIFKRHSYVYFMKIWVNVFLNL